MNIEPMVVLLVEDDDGHAEIVRRNFEDCPVPSKLMRVADGQAALDYLFRLNDYSDPVKAPRPGIILLDLRMPRVNGLEVLKVIKADAGLCVIPVVVLTTSEAEMDIAKAYESHANSYLVKPVNFNKFTELLKTFGYYWLEWNQRPH